MITLPFLSGKTIAVVGLGKTGTSTARALAASGARALAWDDSAAARDAAIAAGVGVTDLYGVDFSAIDAVIWSPGIPHTWPTPHALADKARACGLSLVCDVELLGRTQPDAAMLAVTGTNGKSTTTSLLGHILKASGRPTEVGGNLGVPVLDLAPLAPPSVIPAPPSVIPAPPSVIPAPPSVIPAPPSVIPAPPSVIPAKAGIHAASPSDQGATSLDSRFRGNDEGRSGNDQARGEQGWYVLELSSYQLELIERIRFDVAVLLNITPDHLSRHGGLEGYVAAKRRLFAHLKHGGTAVIGVDDAPSRAIQNQLGGIAVSAERPVAGGVYVLDGWLTDDRDGEARQVLDLRTVAALPGRHNWQNAAAAFAAARAVGVPEHVAVAAIRSFPGLAHRQQRVGVLRGVAFVNDSKATNADAAEKALVCYQPIYWILGGQAKEGGIASLAPHFPRVAHAFLIGEAAEDFAHTLARHGVPFTHCGTLPIATRKAAEMAWREARPGAVVLLSPACASWDQFTSFEQRGDDFRRIVEALAGER